MTFVLFQPECLSGFRVVRSIEEKGAVEFIRNLLSNLRIPSLVSAVIPVVIGVSRSTGRMGSVAQSLINLTARFGVSSSGPGVILTSTMRNELWTDNNF